MTHTQIIAAIKLTTKGFEFVGKKLRLKKLRRAKRRPQAADVLEVIASNDGIMIEDIAIKLRVAGFKFADKHLNEPLGELFKDGKIFTTIEEGEVHFYKYENA